MYQKMRYAWYILGSILDRLAPLRPTYFALNTFYRFNDEYSGTAEYAEDKKHSGSKSVFWRLIASAAAEATYRRRCSDRLKHGFFGIWVKTTFRMAALSLTGIALSEPLVWTFQQLFNQ